MKKSVSLGTPMKEVQAQSYFQLGTISYQKSNLRAAEDYLRKALSAGLPDNESKAAAYLQLASIAVNRRDFKNVRRYHKLCKEQRPKTKEVVEQLKQLDKFIPRMPG
jgi:Tfp pilus assembly protein PilF